jgi:hypothetical protein
MPADDVIQRPSIADADIIVGLDPEMPDSAAVRIPAMTRNYPRLPSSRLRDSTGQ